MRDDITKKIIANVAKQLGSSIKQVEEIVMTQSAYARYVMEKGAFEGIAFPYLGKFVVDPKKVKASNERVAKTNALKQWDYSKKFKTKSSSAQNSD